MRVQKLKNNYSNKAAPSTDVAKKVNNLVYIHYLYVKFFPVVDYKNRSRPSRVHWREIK